MVDTYATYTIVYEYTISGNIYVVTFFNDAFIFEEFRSTKDVVHEWIDSFVTPGRFKVLWGGYGELPNEYRKLPIEYRDQNWDVQDKIIFDRACKHYNNSTKGK